MRDCARKREWKGSEEVSGAENAHFGLNVMRVFHSVRKINLQISLITAIVTKHGN